MSNKSEATWHPNSGPDVTHANVSARLVAVTLRAEAAEFERDALAHVIERVRAAVGEKRRTEYSYEGISDDEIIDIDDFLPIIDAAPAISLARRDAEVKAQALDEAAEVFATGEWSEAFAVGDVEDDVSAVQATAAWFKSRAAAIRAEAE